MTTEQTASNAKASDRYFSNIDYYFSRGRGITVFNCDHETYKSFLTRMDQYAYKLLPIVVSDIVKSGSFPSFNINEIDCCAIFQDGTIDELTRITDSQKDTNDSLIEKLINTIIFPLYYHHKPIFFFSTSAQEKYRNIIESSLLHTGYNKIINLLLIEQLDSIVTSDNLIFSTPAFLSEEFDSHLFTPIEKMMNDALLKENISFSPQKRIGRFVVDFLVQIGTKKLIVECDGRDYHNPYHDRKRDKELEKHGYRILHFTGSEINRDSERCISKIQAISSYHKEPFSIDDDLDQSQSQALRHITGPVRVLAPAGSGKTKTLINRIVALINSGIEPNKILALAFNKKAADEMKQRLNNKHIPTSNKLSEDGVKVRTFHSFGYEIVRGKYDNWQFEGDGQPKRKEKVKRTREILRESIESFYQIPPRRNKDPLGVFLEQLRKMKMELPHIEEETVEDDGNLIPFEGIFNKYLALQSKYQSFNFDDMIYLSLRKIIDDYQYRRQLQNRFEYILVDEFQDLNQAQILLMQILALPQNNLFIVGDDDQMIYGWRGARIRHIIDFDKRYPESQDCILTTNYRSNKRIVNHSKWLISHNLDRVKKDINPLPDKPSGSFDIKLSESLWKQATYISSWIIEQKQAQNAEWKDFAVLCRYNAPLTVLAMVLDSNQIPRNSVAVGRKNVMEDIFHYLRIILSPGECQAEDFSTVLIRPNHALSKEIINRITSWEAFIESPDAEDLEEWQRKKLGSVVRKLQLFQKQVPDPINSSQELVLSLANEFGLREFYKGHEKVNADLDEPDDEAVLETIIATAQHIPNIEAFFNHIRETIANIDKKPEAEPTLEDADQRDEVTLTTIHKAKGKEYSNVAYFDLGADEKLSKQSDIEEERRVTYVGMTRAIKNILITAPDSGYSNFLPELAFNAKLKKLSDVKLNIILSRKQREIAVAENQVSRIENAKSLILKKYPELKGERYSTGGGIFQFIKVRIRKNKLDKAFTKVDTLEKGKSDLIEKQIIPLRDTIEQIEIEKKFRALLEVDKQNKSSAAQ